MHRTDNELRPVRPEEAKDVFALIQARIAWMDRKGIRQWNACGYDKLYPLSYYRAQAEAGRLYALWDAGRLAAAAVLLEEDPRWPDRPPALYVHNFVSSPALPGAGRALLSRVTVRARALEKRFVRLDCMQENPALNQFYRRLGFTYVSAFQEGDYRGNRWQLSL